MQIWFIKKWQKKENRTNQKQFLNNSIHQNGNATCDNKYYWPVLVDNISWTEDTQPLHSTLCNATPIYHPYIKT